MKDAHMFGAAEAALAIAEGRLCAMEVFRACQEQIERHNPYINALITLDLENARQTAKMADDFLQRQGDIRGFPLLGVPFSVKDSFATQNLRTTSSTPVLADYYPARDATTVSRLRAAGGVMMGKSNLPELAGNPQCWSPLFGPTRNPWNTELTPGGSSGGSAAAIAMGFSLLELGSDIAGSIRIPAAYCGVAALKATENLIPRTGHIPHMPGQLRTVRHMLSFGLLGKQVADLQLGLPILVGPDGEDSEVPPCPQIPQKTQARRLLRIAWWDDFPGIPLCQSTRHGLLSAVERLQALGHQVERAIPANFDFERVWQAYGIIMGSEVGLGASSLERLMLQVGAFFMPRHLHLSRAFVRGMRLNMINYNRALAIREALITQLESFLSSWDVWLCPTAPTVAYKAFPWPKYRLPPSLRVDGKKVSYIEATVSLTVPFSLTGHPVVSLPAGIFDGLPVGLQVIGRRWQDAALLEHCIELEQCLGGGVAPPLASL